MRKTVYINIDAAVNNTDAIIKYIDSDRSDGKTTHIVRMSYDNMHECGKMGVVARRHKGDITKTYAETLLDNLRVVRPNVGELTFTGSPARDGIFLFEDGTPFAQVIPLSRIDSIKSTLDQKRHKNLYIDEYVPLSGRYLKNEVTDILETWFTIDRRTYTNDIYVFSNRPAISNPLFAYFKVIPRIGLSTWKNGRFLLLRVVNRGNREQLKDSPFGELIEDTPYADYAYGGKGAVPVERLICRYHGKERLPFIIKQCDTCFAFYHANNALIIDYAERTAKDVVYTTQHNAGHNGGIHLSVNSDLIYSLRIMFLSSRIFFASEQILFECDELYKILGGKD